MPQIQLHNLLQNAEKQLAAVSTTPALDAELLCAFVLSQPRSWVVTHRLDTISAEIAEKYTTVLAQRTQGVPLAYITHEKEFYGRQFYVDERVLIPRPETELLIDAVCAHSLPEQANILDIGTGSGCIAITLKKELQKDAQITALDISPDALAVARRNAKNHDTPIHFVESNLFSALPSTAHHSFTVIVANPPYVDPTTLTEYSAETASLHHEPRVALVPPNENSFSIIEKILSQAPLWLAPHGHLYIEIGHNHGAQAQEIAKKYFPNATIQVQRDIASKDRLLSVSLPLLLNG